MLPFGESKDRGLNPTSATSLCQTSASDPTSVNPSFFTHYLQVMKWFQARLRGSSKLFSVQRVPSKGFASVTPPWSAPPPSLLFHLPGHALASGWGCRVNMKPQ